MKVNLKFWQETYSHLKLCCLENLKKHVPLKPYKEREAGTLSCWGQKFEFLHIFEKSTEGLKDFYAKSVSSAHQDFLITQRQRQVHTHLMSEGREVDYEVTLSRSFCWPFFFFSSCQPNHYTDSPMWIRWKFCERIVFGGQDLFWAFLPKWNTQQIRE